MSEELIKKLKELRSIMNDIFTDHEEELRSVDISYGENAETDFEDIMIQVQTIREALEI